MAIKPANNDAFYREVDEELRRDQMASVWKRFGIIIILAVLMVIAAIGGYLYWQHRQTLRAGEHAELFTRVLDDLEANRTQGAAARLETLRNDGSEGYRAVAAITRADLAVQENRPADAIAQFRALAADEGVAEPFRQLALVRQTALEFDKVPPATVIARLTPLAVAGGPWFGSAGEMVALAHMQRGKPEAAAPIFAAIARDATLPGSLRSRAVQMAGALGIDATAPADTKE